FRHLLDGEGAQDGLRQDLLDEEVVSQDHGFAGLGAQRLQDWAHLQRVPVIPGLRLHDRLHVRDTLHGLAVAVGPGEAERRAQSWTTKVTRSCTSRASSRASR